MKTRKPLLLIAALILVGQSALAIVNIESIRLKDSSKNVLASLTFKANKNEGNSNTNNLSLSADTRVKRNGYEHLFVASGKYGESQGVQNANKLLGHYRFVWTPQLVWSKEYFVQIEKDEFKKLSLRTLAGLGLRQRLHKDDNIQVYAGLGVFYSREEYKDTSKNSKSSENLARANLYLSVKLDLDEKISFLSINYFQPVVDDLSDYRFLTDDQFVVKATEHFSVAFVYQQTHDNKPPLGVKKTDHQYGTTLKFNF